MVRASHFSLQPPTKYYGWDCYCYRSWEKSRRFTIKIVNNYCSHPTKTSKQILPSGVLAINNSEKLKTGQQGVCLSWGEMFTPGAPHRDWGEELGQVSHSCSTHATVYLHPHIITAICKEFPNLLFKFNMLIHSSQTFWEHSNIIASTVLVTRSPDLAHHFINSI